jgi:type II secretory pathway pseudopilin PulG
MNFKGKKWGFTIIELLTVMSIIVILISLLVPSLNAVRRYSRVVRQKGQFHDIGTGLEMFSIDFDGYPDSSENGLSGGVDDVPYCGAMKLCEAMFGQDGLGFHPDSVFKRDGKDNTLPTNRDLYPPTVTIENRRQRKNTYVDPDKYKMCAVEDLYDSSGTSPYDPCSSVISDVFMKIKGSVSDERIGMPVLYYKADVTKFDHDETVALGKNIYDYRDNDGLTALLLPDRRVPPPQPHPLNSNSTEKIPPFRTGTQLFYEYTRNKKASTVSKPYNENTFILISAGWDGFYGTKDDVYNFAE